MVQSRLIQLCDRKDKPSNSDAPVKPGDTILLRSGWHGILSISGRHYDQPVSLAAAPGQMPQVGWVEIGGGKHSIVRELTVSSSLAPNPFGRVPHVLVRFGERGGEDGADLVVENCFVYSAPDTKGWTARDWLEKPANGIWLGRHGRRNSDFSRWPGRARPWIMLGQKNNQGGGNTVRNNLARSFNFQADAQVKAENNEGGDPGGLRSEPRRVVDSQRRQVWRTPSHGEPVEARTNPGGNAMTAAFHGRQQS